MPDPLRPDSPPDVPRVRRSDETAPLQGPARWAFRLANAAFLLALALMLADAFLGARLPQPWRGALPFVFAGGVGLALVLYVSAYGAPKRPTKPGAETH